MTIQNTQQLTDHIQNEVSEILNHSEVEGAMPGLGVAIANDTISEDNSLELQENSDNHENETEVSTTKNFTVIPEGINVFQVKCFDEDGNWYHCH